jgi:hypothetical protein
MKMDGTMLVNQMFYQADSFSNGVAIVQLEEEGTYKYKLMNKEGKFLIEESDISSINSIGNNYFSVSKDSNMYLDYTANMYSKNAIFNWQGKQLTDYNYYNANSISEELISVCDDMSTFVINSKGELVKEYPKLNGIGSISSIGEIMKAELDRGLVYFNKGGKIIWQWDNIIDLGDGITAEHHNYRADRFMYICYPEIKGLGNEQIQKEINEQIEDIFIGDNPKSEEDNGEQDAYIEDTTINYLIEKNKDIIILLKSDSYYPLGAAHGSGYLTYYHLNINNGRTYKLSDLFKKDSNYTGVLRDIINKKIAEENQEELAFYDNVIEIGENQGFTVNKDYLEIYFQQYEIAPYAAGFPSFEIPYGDIIDIIDTEGEFWNSFEKSITVSEVNVSEVNEPSIEAKDAITKLLYSYENNLVEAINNNDFELVKPTLLEGSGLYTSQEKLVTNLYSKGIKEKIEDFAVKDIVKGKHSYLVYVEEAIAIQYPEKEFEVKNFDWVYTVVYEKESGEYLLTGIEKWEK